MRVARLLLLLGLAFVIAGCGSDEQAATGAAELVPASAPAYVAVNSNVDSKQWRQVEELLKKFPDGAQLALMLRSSFEEDSKLDWKRDVKPALGDEIALVWLDLEGGGMNVVAVTKPKDEDKLRAAIEKTNASDGDDLVVGEVGDWLVLSDSQAKIDRFRQQSGQKEKLADDETFKDAVAELPDDALVTVFARGKDLLDAVQALVPAPVAGSLFSQAGPRPEVIAAALAAQDEGLRLAGLARAETDPAAEAQSYESKLLADVPGDAVAFLTFRGGEAFNSRLKQLQGGALGQLEEFERMFGLKIDAITALFKNEVALYVRGGTPLPEITLLLEALDEQAALRTVEDVIKQVTRLGVAQPCHEPEEQGGVTVQCVQFESFKIRYAAFDGKVIVTTGAQSIEEIRSGGPRLSDDDGFKSSRDAAGLPGEYGGFVWLDFEDGLPLVLGLADASGQQLPAEVRRNIEPLRSLVAWAKQDGRTSTAQLFIAID